MGKLNSKGQSKSTDHVTEEKALKFVQATIKKKEKEGYVKKASSKVVAAKKITAPKTVAPKKVVMPKKATIVPKKVSKPRLPKGSWLSASGAPTGKLTFVAKKSSKKSSEDDQNSDEVFEPVPTSYVLPALYSTDARKRKNMENLGRWK